MLLSMLNLSVTNDDVEFPHSLNLCDSFDASIRNIKSSCIYLLFCFISIIVAVVLWKKCILLRYGMYIVHASLVVFPGAVTHPSTDHAQCCLTSVIARCKHYLLSNKLIRKSSQWKKKGFVIFLGCGKGLVFGTKRVIARKVNKNLFSRFFRFWVPISKRWSLVKSGNLTNFLFTHFIIR